MSIAAVRCTISKLIYIRRKEKDMKEIFQEYGGILITVVAIMSVLLVVTAVIGTDTSSPVAQAFMNLFNNFVAEVKFSGSGV